MFASCSKDDDDNTVAIQNHDDNKTMRLMHGMAMSMDSLTMTNDPDNDFAMMMMVHHKGAINMANLELKEGKDSTLHQMARMMISEQQKEIASLDSFVKAHSPTTNEPLFHQKAEMSMQIMAKNADLQIINGNVDHDFATLMIQHHQGAVDMAQLELKYGKSDKLKHMAQKMIDSQQNEIGELQDWLLNRK